MKYNIYTPVVTIFDDNMNVDLDGNKLVIEHLISNGVDGIVPLGSTGEFTEMSLEEKKKYLKFYVEEVNNRVELLPGTGCSNYRDTVELSNYVLSLGVKGVLIVGQYYYGMDDEDIFNYFDKLAKDIEGNIYIYNFPQRTGFDMSAETLYKLLENNPNIKGMKDTNGSIDHTKELITKVIDDFPYFEMFSGFDNQFITNITSGGVGCIAALSNLVPDMWSKWVKAAENNDLEKLKEIGMRIDKMMELYRMDSNISYLFKSILKGRGLDINTKSLFPFDGLDTKSINKALEIVEKNYI